ncbi:hypothetical protein SmJEL517_g03825 [Synchytrium microbalum]|uniref:Uncharacterized protein n=1 Tax=Synchytrium microbalum TaxID=1806994 RepID=A0A507BWL4_9FUNG|nr:uncharacterized protein SmJEL517_g03825 [Synchytrium microbalum]TPX33217.1 hypothetical protein SmJEL517_g03825 [Synchytrium microbalum]
MLGFILATITALVLKSQGSNIFTAAATPECDANCWNYLAVDRISLAMVIYHAFFMLLLLGVTSSQDPRARLQNGFWPLKFVLFVGTMIGVFFIASPTFYTYWIAALFFSALFILLQSMILVDFAHTTAETWVANAEETGSSFWTSLLIGTAVLLYSAVITGSALLYNYYTQVPGCGLNIFFITFNLILVVFQSVVALLPAVQEANPTSGLLQPAMLSLYNTYLIGSAVANNPQQCSSGATSSDASWTLAIQIIGAILTLLALGYSAVSSGSSEFTGSSDDMDDEQEGTAYNYSFFHFAFLLASFFMASVVTNWGSLNQYDTTGNTVPIAIDKGYGAIWVKVVSSWVNVLLYMWTLCAPLLFPDLAETPQPVEASLASHQPLQSDPPLAENSAVAVPQDEHLVTEQAQAPSGAAVIVTVEDNGKHSRVKVYELSDQGDWVDKGTGQVETTWVEPKDGVCILVRSEDTGAVTLNSKIRKDPIYQRQQETLIVWTEPNGTDLALSFQEPGGCQDVWDSIESVQKRLAIQGSDIDPLPASTTPVEGDGVPEKSNGPFTLPAPALANLKEIEQAVTNASRTIFGRDQLLQALHQDRYLETLLSLLGPAEDMEMMEELFALSAIIRMVIFLNESNVYDYILQDEVFEQVAGILEYDREFPHIKASHRDHLQSKAHFKEIIPIPNKDICAKITLVYRVQFLKDVALARLLDDSTFSTMNSLIFFNHVDIVNYFQSERDYLNQLFEMLSNEDVSMEKKKDVILLLHELTSIAKTLQVASRNQFYRSLGNHGLFAIFEYTLADTDMSIRLAVTAILTSVLEHDPGLVRSFCLAQAKNNHRPLIDLIIERFLQEPDSGLRSQFAEIIRVLLDTTGLDTTDGIISHVGNDEDGDNFLKMFYEKQVLSLLDPIVTLDANMIHKQEGRPEVLVIDKDRVAVCNHICELVCFMIKHHTYRSKFYLLNKLVLEKFVLLFKCKDVYVRLSALRVIRTVIGMKDEFYNRHLTKADVFGPILSLYKETKGRYNMMNSALLELFEFIKKESVKLLINHMVSNHRKLMESIPFGSLAAIILRYEQLQDTAARLNGPSEAEPATIKPKQHRDGWSKLDEDEEAYFNGSDDDDDPTHHHSSSGNNHNSNNNSSSTTMQEAAYTTPRVVTPPPTLIPRARSQSPPLRLASLSPPPASSTSIPGRNKIEFIQTSSPRPRAPITGLVDYDDDEVAQHADENNNPHSHVRNTLTLSRNANSSIPITRTTEPDLPPPPLPGDESIGNGHILSSSGSSSIKRQYISEPDQDLHTEYSGPGRPITTTTSGSNVAIPPSTSSSTTTIVGEKRAWDGAQHGDDGFPSIVSDSTSNNTTSTTVEGGLTKRSKSSIAM